ncbi:probable E3 ubiquitin-protein ligase TRIML1 [Rana temporaria]|uniref:probable E3 ubiquitin-protein ligase TRIML1 n=1 Tax=Rana temporaria TaxID=8407 RepID=UPI001AACF0A9|nr:probable E3 ubiquitin-protein ligase TRIML1 [Rana temporaria]
MASADLRKELECSVCLNIYTDPVTLKCGHNFCRDCIGRVWDTQEGSGGYSCPECREESQNRPALHRNITLRNIVENFLSTHPDQEESGVFCTCCIHTPVPAVISCLHCEASLCDNHLRVHSKSPEHVLCDPPTTSLENRKCSVHKKILEYYCTEDSSCICVYCGFIGDHRGHQAGGPNIGAVQQTSGVSGVTDILLDERTACNYLHISDDRKTVSVSSSHQNHPETPERFQYSQVMSSQRFSSGRHYWEVDVGGAQNCRVGMCYPSIDRTGDQSVIGCNKKSWSLEGWGPGNEYSVRYDKNKIRLPGSVSSKRVRIDLDYEAGRISFYDLCDPIRHLHTFTTTFTEPLHAGVYIVGGCIKICGGGLSDW